MKKNIFIKYISVAAIIISSAVSQNGTIKGLVLDKTTKNPLIGANVFIVGTSLGTASNDAGSYKITNVFPDVYTIRATYIGYEMFETEITLQPGENLEQNFELNYATIEGQVVEVTAQARGQMDAINRQLKAKSIKNIVSSDRIQELPDANAAEAVARVPGVSIRREGGEGNKVVIRGLSPKYNKITVNGTNLASTDADDRSTDLSMISQYMLEGIEVTKAGTPDQEADVLGGTVNFKLKKAKPGVHGNIVTQGMDNRLGSSSSELGREYKLVLDLSNRFFNNRLGVLGQIDRENRNRSSNQLSASYVNTPADLDTINPLKLGTLNLSDVPRLNKRNNSLMVIDYNIPNGNISYSGLNSSIKKDVTNYTNSYNLQYADGQRSFLTGELKNTINVTSETWKYEQSLTPELRVELYSSFSKSTNGDTNKVYNFLTDGAYVRYDTSYDDAGNINFDADGNAELIQKQADVSDKSVYTLQNFLKNDTNGTWFDRYDYNEYKTTEKERSYGLNLEYDVKLSNQISGKIKLGFKTRNKTRSHDRDYDYAAFTYVAHVGKRDSTFQEFDWLPYDELAGQIYAPYYYYMDNDYSDEGFLGGDNVIDTDGDGVADTPYELGPFADIDKMNQLFSFFRQNWNWAPYHENIMHHSHKTQSLIFDYSGTESYNARYVMADMNIGSKLNVVSGFRLEDMRTRYTSFHGQQTTLPHYNSMGSDTVSTHVRTNTFNLPALFLRYQPLEWLILRYANTNTLTRPNYSDVIPLYNINGAARAVEYRNPFLEPALSENEDFVVALNNEYLGLLSFSYFTKKIDGLIFSSGQRYITDADLYALPGFTEKYRINDYKANNDNPVNLRGFEIDYQTRFWYLPNALRGLVFNANYTRTTSEVKYPRTVIENVINLNPFSIETVNIDSTYAERLLDQPNDIINLSLGYDYKGFSGRLSMLYTSDVFSTVSFWPGLRESTDSYQRYDLSMKQKLPIEGLELYLNISNLTQAVDIRRLRGYNQNDPNFDSSILFNYDEDPLSLTYGDIIGGILDPALYSTLDPETGERVSLNPDISYLLERVPRSQRAKSSEEHYGMTIDLGFRFAF